MTVGPNPFSREGSQPGDGLGEANRFETLADGATPEAGGYAFPPQAQAQAQSQPQAQAEPWSAYAEPPQGYPGPQAYPEPGANAFPSYPTGPAEPAALQPYPPQQYQQPYPQPYQGYAYGPLLQNSPHATTALVTGIIGAFCGITGPIAVGFAIAALHQIRTEPQRYGGRGLAIGGLVTGLIGCLWMLFWMIGILSG